MVWYGSLLRRRVERCGQVSVIQPLNRAEVCAGSCSNAKRELCECSCLGTYHGGGRPGRTWKVARPLRSSGPVVSLHAASVAGLPDDTAG